MKTKLDYLISVSLIVMLLVSGLAVARPEKKGYKRVIADDIDEDGITSLKNKGCLVKHKLKRGASFECPEDILPQVGVRDSRIFYIVDLAADQQIGADKVWAEGIDGSGVNVAILDTGIDTDHPDLKDSYLGGHDYVFNDTDPEDDHGHGSHVSGIITSNGLDDENAKGVAPGAGIYMYKVCDSGGSCYEDDMMAAMEAAVLTDAKVMSMSIGGLGYATENCDSDPLAAQVNSVVSEGLTVVVAAGNDGKTVATPGCASGAIAVGAVNSNNDVVSFSGRGPALDIVAPGYNIYSALIGGYGYMSGTSMATPHVAGVAALLLQTDSGLATDEIKTALYRAASPVNRCYECLWLFWGICIMEEEVLCTSEITGAGVVNAYDAYLAVVPTQANCTIDSDCDDGLWCNGAETCQAGTCQSGTPVDCSYLGEECTLGVCEEATDGYDCIQDTASMNGQACDDHLYCNAGETCQDGECGGGSALDCDDNEVCTEDSCNEDTNKCENQPVPDGTDCDDGLWCWADDECTAGVCEGTLNYCSDGVSCTLDVCDGSNRTCLNVPFDILCDDGLYCNGVETCDAVSDCQLGTPIDCSANDELVAECDYNPDGITVTYDYYSYTSSCDEGADSYSCTAAPAGWEDDMTHTCDSRCSAECEIDGDCIPTECDQLDGCVGNDYHDYNDVDNTCEASCTCTNNACGEPTIYYNDPRCTECEIDDDCDSLDDDYCDGTAVKHDEGRCANYECTVETTTVQECNDGLWCSGAETCDAVLGCQAGTPINCDDGVSCTVDSCNEDTGSCSNVPDDGLCDDGVSCTVDSCNEVTSCDNTWPGCGGISDGCCGPSCSGSSGDANYDGDCVSAVLCWSGSNIYLYRRKSQLRKFCRCAEGNYGYNSYSFTWSRQTVYYYTDSANNENWAVSSRKSYLPVDEVVCLDDQPYPTDQDYYYPQ